MEVRWDLLLVVIGCAIVTLLPRIIPLLVLSKVEIPEWGLRWLNHIPIAILAALLAQALFMHETMKVDYLVAAIPTFLVAIFTRSLLGAVLTGVIAVFLLRFFLSVS
ncbi:AzlD domain-containing protein [Bacillus sp. 123MFChir2]|uniref:AzlD domain-containing protein n=1 Tax=Bacillus sp. 123MFChir2 TaxID=1169144 RepID=UPI00037E1C19|nr:AzlD domain-containing protein [Bacillus sp. 123MFChir2]